MSLPKIKLATIIYDTNIVVDNWEPFPDDLQNVPFRFMTSIKTQCPKLLSLIRKAKYSVHTSLFNKWYLLQIYKIPEQRIIVIDFNHTVEIYDPVKKENFYVTAIEANYYAGSTMFLFEGSFGNVLYTGYFRTSVTAPIYNCPSLQRLIKKKKLDKIFIDNSYAAEHCTFPTRYEAIQEIIQFIRNSKTSEIIISGNQLGKEEVLLAVASNLDERICVSPMKFKVFQLLKVENFFTLNRSGSRIRVVDHLLNSLECQQIFEESKTCVIILLTALYKYGPKKFPSKLKFPRLHIVPYSGHCNHTELKEFISILQPRTIVPIINNCEGRPWSVIPRSILDLCSKERTEGSDSDSVEYIPEEYRPVVLIPRIASLENYVNNRKSEYRCSTPNSFETKKTENLVVLDDDAGKENLPSPKESHLSEKILHSLENILKHVEATSSDSFPHFCYHKENDSSRLAAPDTNEKENGSCSAGNAQPSRKMSDENHSSKDTIEYSELLSLNISDENDCNVPKRQTANNDIDQNENTAQNEIQPIPKMSGSNHFSKEYHKKRGTFPSTAHQDDNSSRKKLSSPLKVNTRRFSHGDLFRKKSSAQHRRFSENWHTNKISSSDFSPVKNSYVQIDRSAQSNTSQNELQDFDDELLLTEDIGSLSLFSNICSNNRSVNEENQTSNVVANQSFDSDSVSDVSFESENTKKVGKINEKTSRSFLTSRNAAHSSLLSPVNCLRSSEDEAFMSVSYDVNTNYPVSVKRSTSDNHQNNVDSPSENDRELVENSINDTSRVQVAADVDPNCPDLAINELNSCQIIEEDNIADRCTVSSDECSVNNGRSSNFTGDHSESDSDDCIIVGEYIQGNTDISCILNSHNPPRKKFKLDSSLSSNKRVTNNNQATHSILFHFSKLYNFKNCKIRSNQWDYLTGCNIFSHRAYKRS